MFVNLQIDLQTDHKITAIATQGHWDENVKQYPEGYYLRYKQQASGWAYYPVRLFSVLDSNVPCSTMSHDRAN